MTAGQARETRAHGQPDRRFLRRLARERRNRNGAASHLARYWTPKMIREIIAFAERAIRASNPRLVSGAIEALKQRALGR